MDTAAENTQDCCSFKPERNMEALLVSSAIESMLTHDILLAIFTGARLLYSLMHLTKQFSQYSEI